MGRGTTCAFNLIGKEGGGWRKGKKVIGGKRKMSKQQKKKGS